MKTHLATSLPSAPSQEVKAGHVLFGNDLSESKLQLWYQQEEEAFFEGDAGNGDTDEWYAYMRFVNERVGFAHVDGSSSNVQRLLVLGPGSGKEIEEFNKRHPNCTLNFLEASKNFQRILLNKFNNSNIVQPHYSGCIDLPSESIDLVTAFSVLHHIPNVEKVIAEAGRVLRSGGYFLVREPCSSMGDWGGPRSATPNERGIGKKLMIKFAKKAGFELVMLPVPILFEPFNRLIKKTIGFKFVSFDLLYLIDIFTSKILSMNDYYWRDSYIKKFGPSSYFYVFKKA